MRQLVAAGPVVAAVAVVAGVGYAYGVFTDRWGPSGQLEQAVAALAKVKDAPPAAGEWAAAESPAQKIEDDVLKLGGIKEYMHQGYANPKTGELVSVLIVCGRGGPISVHTPDICYAGAGFRQIAPEKPVGVEVGGQRQMFQTARFAKPGGVDQDQLEIFWAWSKDGRTWDAPENPRMAFARLPAVYKMYVVRNIHPTPAKTDDGAASRAFLEAAIPAIGNALAPAPAPAPGK
ncbi:MAG: EpsI family protein [Gemmataceae bacterium]|nr:EpsI family protein [Gemmataceae bacterium]